MYRQPPPPESVVTGSRIVIGHDEARWQHDFVSRRPIPARPRAEAFAMATELYRVLQVHPERFAALVSEASEHRDAAQDGDFGTWSTRERTPFPRQL